MEEIELKSVRPLKITSIPCKFSMMVTIWSRDSETKNNVWIEGDCQQELHRKRARAGPNQREHNICRFGSGGRGGVGEGAFREMVSIGRSAGRGVSSPRTQA